MELPPLLRNSLLRFGRSSRHECSRGPRLNSRPSVAALHQHLLKRLPLLRNPLHLPRSLQRLRLRNLQALHLLHPHLFQRPRHPKALLRRLLLLRQLLRPLCSQPHLFLLRQPRCSLRLPRQ